jgi:SpoVK/Ycf46/Vps4 family AAA+-type ATPase
MKHVASIKQGKGEKVMIKAREVVDYLRAGYSCFWVVSPEPRRAERLLTETITGFTRKDGGKYTIKAWDCVVGQNPIAPIQELTQSDPELTIKILRNYHWFIDKPQIIQYVQNSVEDWKALGKAIIIISTKSKIPNELEKDFTVMDFGLPDDGEIDDTIRYVAEEKVAVPDGEEFDKLRLAGRGLTQLELENALARSIVTKGSLDVSYLNDHKAMTIDRGGLFEVVDTRLTFNDIRGYDNMKDFCWPLRENDLGVIAIGPPGCGKTLFGYCHGGQSGRLVLKLDAGKMFSKFQGETDQNIREAQAVLKAVAPVYLIIDEFEKQFAGAASDGTLDSGTSRRAAGKWLEFLEYKNRPKGVYVYATMNSFRGVPPEYLRPGRWDNSPFFIDLPTEDEQADILQYWVTQYSLEAPHDPPNMDLWTGAEIESCCRIAKNKEMTLKQASRFVLAQARTMDTEISDLRQWAMGGTEWREGEGRAIPASKIRVNGAPKRKRVKLDR